MTKEQIKEYLRLRDLYRATQDLKNVKGSDPLIQLAQIAGAMSAVRGGSDAMNVWLFDRGMFYAEYQEAYTLGYLFGVPK